MHAARAALDVLAGPGAAARDELYRTAGAAFALGEVDLLAHLRLLDSARGLERALLDARQAYRLARTLTRRQPSRISSQ